MGVFYDKGYIRTVVYIDGKVVADKTGFKNKTHARRWHDEQKALFKGNPGARSENKKVLFFELVNKYLEDYIDIEVKNSTKTRYLIDINYRIIPEFGNKKLSNITEENINVFRRNLVKAKKLSHASINRCMDALNSIFERGIEFGLCSNNPCKRTRRLKEIKRPYRWLRHWSDAVKFLDSVEEHHYYLFYRVALETGMRLGELVGLTWDSVNLEIGQIEIYKQYNMKTKRYEDLKNSKYRTVWLTDSTLPLIKQLKMKSVSENVFAEKDGSIVNSYSVSGNFFHAQQKRAGVPVINFHGIRHTYASHFMMNGGELYKLSELFGHSSIKVTMQYAHLSPESIEENKNRVSFDNSKVIQIQNKIKA